MSLDIYGLLKHYRDELSWYDEEEKHQYIILGTKDVQVILERYWRKQIAEEIDALCTDECQLWDRIQFHNGHSQAANIARGKRD